MSWFSTGFEEAEKMKQASGTSRSRKKFWTRPGEPATVRFLAPAKESFNYKRSYVKWLKGEKFLTSPGTHPDPLVQAGLTLQNTYGWKIIDRRVLEFEVEENGETVTKTVGPRLLYFAEGIKTRNALIAFEKEIRNQVNEERAEDNLPPLTEDEFNLTHFDVKMVKEKGAPWQFFAVRGGKARPLSEKDEELLEKYDFELREELKPLPTEQLSALLRPVESEQSAPSSDYSYGGDDDDEEPTFFDS